MHTVAVQVDRTSRHISTTHLYQGHPQPPDQSSAKRWPRCFLCTLLKWPSQVTSCVSPSQPVYRIALHSTFLLQLITATEQVYVSTKHAHSGCASRSYKQTHIYNTCAFLYQGHPQFPRPPDQPYKQPRMYNTCHSSKAVQAGQNKHASL
jgi:hypothetical protein